MIIFKKNTLSICNNCYRVISACIKEVDNKVVMEKYCPSHGIFLETVEKDPYFYKRTMNFHIPGLRHTCEASCPNCYAQRDILKTEGAVRRKHFCCLMIPVSYSCNLNCDFCYFSYRKTTNPSLSALKHLISRFDGPKISLTGGEPTLRDDLADLVRLVVKSGKICSIATNGLRLADIDYAAKLKQAGLETLVFSLNTLDCKLASKIGEKDSIAIKLKALENLKKLGIKVKLSTTLFRNANVGGLSEIYNYCINNLDFITNWRIRSVFVLGNYAGGGCLYTSEMVEFVGRLIGVAKKKLIDSFNRRVNYSPNFVFNIILYLLRQDNGVQLLDWDTNVRRRMPASLRERIILEPYRLRRTFLDKKSRSYKEKVSTLGIDIIAWPTKYNLDVEEIKYSFLHHLTEDGRILPFSYALLENEKQGIK
ncbi:MAG: radical SAM protein [Candidatus Omnitrophica bacterium]|nr:radical SAM protein [Candidatus Omnitrophota bacterium]